MRFIVRTVNGKRAILELDSRDGVDNFSTFIQDKEEIPVDRFSTCIQDEEETPLESELPHFCLKCDFADSKLYIQFSSVSGKKILFEVESSNIIANVRPKFEDNDRVCSDPFLVSNSLEHQDFKEVKVQIFVKTGAMKMITIEVVSSNTRDDVKTKIQNIKRKSPDSLVSQFLPDRNFVDVRMLISIKTVTGKTVALEVESFGTIDKVWTGIHGKEEIPPQLAVSNSLLHCDHVKGSIKIFVKEWSAKGQRITLDVEGTDTIDLVKTKIEDRLAIPSSRQTLLFGGICLGNERTVAQYDIEKGCTLCLIVSLWQITVERLDSVKTFTIQAKSSATVHMFKNTIRYKEGIFPDQQRLFFEGKQLEAGDTLADCNLYNMCTVLLEVTRKRTAHSAVDSDSGEVTRKRTAHPAVDSDSGEDSAHSTSGEDSVHSNSEDESP